MKSYHPRKKGKWRTSGGKIVNMKDMSDEHLNHAIAYVERIYFPASHEKYRELLEERDNREFATSLKKLADSVAKRFNIPVVIDPHQPKGIVTMCSSHSSPLGNARIDMVIGIDLAKKEEVAPGTYYAIKRREPNPFLHKNTRSMTKDPSEARLFPTIQTLLEDTVKMERHYGFNIGLNNDRWTIAKVEVTKTPETLKADPNGSLWAFGFNHPSAWEGLFWNFDQKTQVIALKDASLFESESEALTALAAGDSLHYRSKSWKLVRVAKTNGKTEFKVTDLA